MQSSDLGLGIKFMEEGSEKSWQEAEGRRARKGEQRMQMGKWEMEIDGQVRIIGLAVSRFRGNSSGRIQKNRVTRLINTCVDENVYLLLPNI